jgi:hypothetical protein
MVIFGNQVSVTQGLARFRRVCCFREIGENEMRREHLRGLGLGRRSSLEMF